MPTTEEPEMVPLVRPFIVVRLAEVSPRVVEMTVRLAGLGAEINELTLARRELVAQLSDDGLSHAQIGQLLGVSRGRVFQIIRSRRGRWDFD